MNLRLREAPRLAIAALIAAAILFGFGALEHRAASAAGQLEMEGSCEPDSVRPNEAALVSCTVTLTNTSGETVTGLSGSVFLAEGCNIPSRFTFIDRTNGDELVRTEPLGLFFELPDLGPGESVTSVSRIAVESFSTGPTGGSLTISSTDKPDASAIINLCWDVQDNAAAPAANLTVTHTPLESTGDVIFIDEPEAPPRPVDGEPVAIAPPLPPVGNELAEFEITVVNVSDATVSEVSLLDVPTGSAEFVGAEPPATGFDVLGRPFWDVGDIAPGEEFGVVTTYGPAAENNCSFADGIASASATDADGSRQDYVAFSDFGVQVGPCVFERPDLCWFFPPEGDSPVTDSCDSEVCWTTSPDGFDWPLFGCEEDFDYCWFTAPGEGGPSLSPCDASVCWVSFGGADFEYWGEVSCDAEFCEYTSPDGRSTTSDCTLQICWAENPTNGFWQEIYGCEEFFGNDTCWFVAPDESRASTLPCEENVCWITFAPGDFIGEVPCEFEFCQYAAPDGSTTATSDCEFPVCWSSPPGADEWQQVYDCGEHQDWCWSAPPGSPELAILNSCDYPLSFAVNLPDGGMVSDPWQLTIFDEGGIDWCWPVPPETGDFYTFPVFCEEIESIYWFQQDDGTYVPSFGPTRGCIEPFPIDDQPIPVLPRPLAGDFIVEPCLVDEEAETGVQGSSVPVEIADGVSTPAELADGTVEIIEPEPSLSVAPVEMERGEVEVIEPSPSTDVTPAEVVPSDRIEAFPFPDFPDDVIILPVDEIDRPTAPPGPRDSIDPGSDSDGKLDADTDAEDIITLPVAGSSKERSASTYGWVALALAMAGAAATAAGLRARRRGL